MPYIVQQCSHPYLLHFGFIQSQGPCDKVCHIHSTYAVLIPGVVGTWKCNICKSQLLDTPQTLHLTGPDKKRLQMAYGNMPVQGIMDISDRLHELLFIQMTLKNLDMAVVNNFLYDSLA